MLLTNIIKILTHNYIETGQYKPITKQDDNYIWQEGFLWKFRCSKCGKIKWRKLRDNEI